MRDSEKLDQVKEIIATYQKSGKKFVDPEFAAKKISLYDYHDTDIKPEIEAAMDNSHWVRASELEPDMQIFRGKVDSSKITPSKIRYGKLLAILSAIADQTGAIESMFEYREIQKAGVYVLYIFVNGYRHVIVIDD